MQQSGRKRRQRSGGAGPEARARLVALIEEATVDAYDESEQAVGLYTMICENLTLTSTTYRSLAQLTLRRRPCAAPARRSAPH